SSALRHNFSDYAWWQPALFTDANGKARFSVKFPDDITNWKARFIAIDGKKRQSGYLETEIPAYKDISATLFTPRFLIQGDSTEVIGQVNNYINDTLAVRASFLKEEQEIFNQSFDLINGKTDVFSVAVEELDSLSLTYRIDLEDGYFDGEKRNIPVLRKGTTETQGEFFVLKNDTSFTIDPSQWSENVTISAYANSVDLALAEIDHLTRYPYECNEQAASKLKGLLAEQTIRKHLGESFKNSHKINRLIKQLEKNQNNDGLWGWWETSPTEVWISLHVLEAFIKAKGMGYKVSFYRSQISNYLLRELRYLSTKDKIRALKILYKVDAEMNFGHHIAVLEKEDFSFAEQLTLTGLKQELGLSVDVESIIQQSHTTLLGNHYWGEKSNDLFEGRIPLTLMAYEILKNAGKDELLPKIRGYFLEKMNQGHWGNTYETAQILETILPDWIDSGEKSMTGSLTIAGEEITSFPYQQTLSKEKPLTIQQKGNSPVYFSIYQTTYNPEPEAVDKDFVVKTWWKDQSSENLEAGKPVSLIVEVEVKQESDYLMIEVPIPAGCSYHNDQLNRALEVHRENYKEKTNIYCRRLGEGKHLFEVSLLPRYSGHYHLNPAKAEQMYFPLFLGRNEGKEVRI
ncbi:MAG: hypothetical protein KDD63_15095, partial [Bacteroidetes bacterium]|nr:hypothetical protein [Bacteroidota bacterium]